MSFKPNLAMVLSGGGPKGSFQVGVMEELITNRGVNFDIFGGAPEGDEPRRTAESHWLAGPQCARVEALPAELARQAEPCRLPSLPRI